MILDTDFLIAILRGDQTAIQKLNILEKQESRLATTTLTVFELMKGAYLSAKKDENLQLVSELISNLDVFHFDMPSSRIAAMLASHLEEKGKPINIIDTLIAGICVFHDDIIVTRNVRHFQQIPNLAIETW